MPVHRLKEGIPSALAEVLAESWLTLWKCFPQKESEREMDMGLFLALLLSSDNICIVGRAKEAKRKLIRGRTERKRKEQCTQHWSNWMKMRCKPMALRATRKRGEGRRGARRACSSWETVFEILFPAPRAPLVTYSRHFPSETGGLPLCPSLKNWSWIRGAVLKPVLPKA